MQRHSGGMAAISGSLVEFVLILLGPPAWSSRDEMAKFPANAFRLSLYGP